MAASSANLLAKPIGVCGESAANPQLAAVLIGLGITSLSMAPSALAEVRGFLAQVDQATCVHAAQAIINLSSAEEAKAKAIEILGN
jgi:phosphotransferase system enzyme I (PtsI)